MKRIALTSLLLLATAGLSMLVPTAAPRAGVPAAKLTPKERLGKKLFFDTNLSSPPGQSCAACHGPEVGFTGPTEAFNLPASVYEGAVKGRFGNRRPPSAAYAAESPTLSFDAKEDVWTGGMFWDGRADGKALGDPLAEQAMGPFLNPLEQAIPDARTLCEKVRKAAYAPLFRQVWGKLDCNNDAQVAYENIGRAIAAYERSAEVNPFNSKYDHFLAGKAKLSKQEQLGLQLFEGKAGCSACHPSKPGPKGEPPLFTDFSYDNLGAPRNPANPFYKMGKEHNPDGAAWLDSGLGGFLKGRGEPAEVYEAVWGAVKVPTLRNVDKRPRPTFKKSFGHNGYFDSLESVVHFYNTRDVLPYCATLKGKAEPGKNCWPVPEVADNVNTEELGKLGLTAAEEAAVVAFMRTLSDQ